jgi:nicotinate (nicotinamide) nucleotide adenylyltransferase
LLEDTAVVINRIPPTMTSNQCLRRQVCLFGTSANPPTGDAGHVGIVKALASLEIFDQVRVLPVYQHSFSTKRNQMVSFEHRVQMCKLAFEGIPKVCISTAEQETFQRAAQGLLETEKESLRVGTAELLEFLLEQESDTDFSFCLGADTFFDLTEWKWKRSHDVLKLLGGRLVVLHRKDAPSSGNSSTNQIISPKDLQERVEHVNQTESANVIILPIPTLEAISSSLVRSCSDETKLEDMVVTDVLEYIKEHRLYGFSEVTES